MADEETARKQRLVPMQQGFADLVPHNHALGMRFVEYGEGRVRMLLPYQEHLVGNPDTKVLHGGAISALLDACCGAAVFIKLRRPAAVATLDLRIDYLKPATPPEDVVCDAHCFKVTTNVAFVRALAFHDDENDPIAAAAGSFIIFEKGKSVMGARG
jgi:uncharacterized protein (TIGR00369 family)